MTMPIGSLIIAISKGLVARNILRNDFFEQAKKHFSKVVIISTAGDDEYFLREFGAGNVEIIAAEKICDTVLDNFFIKCYRFLIYNDRTRMMGEYNYGSDGATVKKLPRAKYWLAKVIFLPLAKIKLLRKTMRYFDYLFLQRAAVKKYRAIISQHRPVAVLATSILDNSEVALIKAAKKENIKTVAMAKSWDNPSKLYFRVKADMMAVWSDFMKSQLKNYQDYRDDQIVIIGVPQFDYYLDKSRLVSRADFCAANKLDPDKKIIFFGSEGKLMPNDPGIVAILRKLISEKKILGDWQIFVRPHFAYNNDHLKFKDFFNTTDVIVDSFHKFSRGFSDMWDYSKEQMDHFLNCLYHSDIIIITASTLALDAAALGKPIIFIKFDGSQKKNKRDSVVGWYTSDYYKAVIKQNAGFVVESADDLKNAINSYYENPDTFKKEQENLRRHFCFKIDGQAGQRLFALVSSFKV